MAIIPSGSAIITSPEQTSTPEILIFSPTVPGPLLTGDAGVSPEHHEGNPTFFRPFKSRIGPSVTNPAAPQFFSIPATRSPAAAQP